MITKKKNDSYGVFTPNAKPSSTLHYSHTNTVDGIFWETHKYSPHSRRRSETVTRRTVSFTFILQVLSGFSYF